MEWGLHRRLALGGAGAGLIEWNAFAGPVLSGPLEAETFSAGRVGTAPGRHLAGTDFRLSSVHVCLAAWLARLERRAHARGPGSPPVNKPDHRQFRTRSGRSPLHENSPMVAAKPAGHLPASPAKIVCNAFRCCSSARSSMNRPIRALAPAQVFMLAGFDTFSAVHAEQFGTAEEARAMLDRAIAALNVNQARAVSEFNNTKNS